jgi:multicomponent Na+:H+ antiporter subunit E
MTRLLTLPVRLVGFVLWFAGQVLKSSWTVLDDILTPGLTTTPRVVRMPLESPNDVHVALIGTLITLTPGTLTLGVVPHDRHGRALLVHTMYHQDTDGALDELNGLQRRLLDALSPGVTS